MNINEAKKRLKASEEKYRRLFETSRDGILILDGVSGEIKDANPYFLEITGYSFAELEGSAPWELAAFGDIIENKNRFEKLKENGVARYDDLPLLTKDGEEIPVEFITNTYQAGGNRVVQCNIRVIKERKELEKKMRLYSQSVKEAAFEVYWINRGGGFDYANKQAARRLGCPAEDLGTKAVWDVDPNFSREEWFEHWEELKKIGVRKFETEHIGAGGEVYPVEITSNYIRHNGNEYELAFAQDISERKNYEQKLEEEREMFILGPTLIFRWGADSENKWPVEYVSPNVTDLLGYEREEFMDKKINYKEIIHPDDLQLFEAESDRARNEEREKLSYQPYRLKCASGEFIWVQDYTILNWEDGRLGSYQGYIVDVTPMKKREEELIEANRRLEKSERKLEKSLEEREVLLQEVHHRVKNNMQQIMGILALQQKEIENRKARQYLRRSQERVQAMGLIHSLLYRSKNLEKLPVGKYIEELIDHIRDTYEDETNVDVELDLNSTLKFDVDCALACGLLVNELICNAYEHGLAGGTRKGKLKVKLQPAGEGRAVLSVADSGPGFSADFDFEAPETLGLQLVRGIVTRELQGEITLHQNKMTEININFLYSECQT